jgi:hypothetical protein
LKHLRNLFTNALGVDDFEASRSIFSSGSIVHPYHSLSVDINQRTRRLEIEATG